MENSYLTEGQTEWLISKGITLSDDPWIKVYKKAFFWGDKEWFYIRKSGLNHFKREFLKKEFDKYINSEQPVFSTLELLDKILNFQKKFPGTNLMLMVDKEGNYQCSFEDPRVEGSDGIILLKNKTFEMLIFDLVKELIKYNIS